MCLVQMQMYQENPITALISMRIGSAPYTLNFIGPMARSALTKMQE